MYKIIDVHTHIYPEKVNEKATDNLSRFYRFTVNSKGTLSDLENQCAASHVTGFFILSVATNAHQVRSVNDFAAGSAEQARKDGFEAYGFGGMHQDFTEMEEEVERAVSMGLCGIKLHPDIQKVDIDDRRLYPLYEACSRLGVPVYFHSGDARREYRFSEPRRIAKILGTFKDLRVAAAHLGGYKAWDEAIQYLKGNERVWYDTSSSLWSMTAECANGIISKIGKERLMFGSDYPGEFISDELERFFALKMTDKELENVLYYNARRFLGKDG